MSGDFYLSSDEGMNWREVTKTEWVAAERAAGFKNTLGQPDEPATSSWHSGERCGRQGFLMRDPRDRTAAADLPVDAVFEDPRIAAVLAYVDKLSCSNCDHVHNDGRKCTVVREFTGPCRCDWGPTDITKDIRNLLKAES